jgi:hypothetical protein
MSRRRGDVSIATINMEKNSRCHIRDICGWFAWTWLWPKYKSDRLYSLEALTTSGVEKTRSPDKSSSTKPRSGNAQSNNMPQSSVHNEEKREDLFI